MARFCPLFSGSSGNSIYIGGASGGILVDVGVSAKALTLALQNLDIDPASINAIFVTHEHTDHIRGLYTFTKRYRIPVYTSAGTLTEIEQKGCLHSELSAQVISQNGVELAGMYITPFATPHDSAESVGYVVKMPDDRSVAIATDLGYLPETVIGAVQGCDLILLESNHDVRMLQNGPYPYYLKRRILSDEGHLSNDACATILGHLLETGTTRFILAHLSKENNLPALAQQTALAALADLDAVAGRDYLLSVAAPKPPEKVMVF